MAEELVSRSIELPSGPAAPAAAGLRGRAAGRRPCRVGAGCALLVSALAQRRDARARARRRAASRPCASSSSAAGSRCRASPRRGRALTCSPPTRRPRRSRWPLETPRQTASMWQPRSPTGRSPMSCSPAGPSTSCWRRTCCTSVQSVAPLLALLPRLAPETWVADPGRPAAAAFLEQAESPLAGRDARARGRERPSAAAGRRGVGEARRSSRAGRRGVGEARRSSRAGRRGVGEPRRSSRPGAAA